MIYVPPIGFVLIPLSLGIFFLRPQYLGPWAIIMSAFQAASVLNIEGGFPLGVSPYFFVLILIAIRFLPLWLGGKCGFETADVAIDITQPLLILTIWAIVSAFLLPWLFAGVGVDVPRLGMDSPHTSPLQWSMSNAAQAMYVTLDAIFVIYVLWCGRTRGYFERLIYAFVICGVIASAIGGYQYLSHYAGLPYPTDFFNSNPGWRQLMSQQLAGISRVSATFIEPSTAGAFFAVWSTLMLFLAAGGGGGWAWPLFVIGVIMVFLTTSTTGYLIGGLVIALFVWKEFVRVFTTGRISGRGLFLMVAIAGAIVAAALFIPNFSAVLAKILWQKTDSQSGHDRATTMWEAVRITAETCGMGAGLGSNRPSGMLFYIASNLGLPGLMLFGVMIAAIYKSLFAGLRSTSPFDRTRGYLGAAGWATAISLTAMAVTGGDITGSQLWICVGVAATGSRAVWLHHEAVGPIELQQYAMVEPEPLAEPVPLVNLAYAIDPVSGTIVLSEEYCIS
jgi:hypothetical protein